MSCFAQSMAHLGQTQIFGRLTGTGTQFLVHQMDYRSNKPNAMILPLPMAKPGSGSGVTFHTLPKYGHFFDDLYRGFPSIYAAEGKAGKKTVGLEVHQVGSHIASFVPTIDDFAKLDPQFVLPKKIWDNIPIYNDAKKVWDDGPVYNDYGFVVIQLKELAGRSHPVAIEFETRTPNDIYYPMFQVRDRRIHNVRWYHHILYMQHAPFDSKVGQYHSGDFGDAATGLVRSKYVARKFFNMPNSAGIVHPDLLVHRNDIAGNLPNRDMFFAAPGDPLVPPIDYRPIKAMMPWGAVVGGMSWLVYRRTKLRMRG